MNKKLLLAIVFVLAVYVNSFSQCFTNTITPNTSAVSCVCLNSSDVQCDLLPDITISWHAILNYMGGPNEYPQICTPSCNGNDGRLRVTGATPNIGRGPLTVEGELNGVYTYVCGTDTFTSPTSQNITCPDGSPAKQLIKQRVWHKSGSEMQHYDRPAGTMTYHNGHNHYHVDDWGIFTLRYQTADPNPLNWPIAATGAKLGFCLMDYFSCPSGSASNHCKDDNTVYNQGNNLNQASQYPNYGLGGGSYSCGVAEQGISSGWEDVYSEALDLMWINLPPGLCNGSYWIVMEVDPNDYFLESDETNNFTAVPYTLTQQTPASTNPFSTISINRQSSHICAGENITLTANAGSSFLWSTGATTQSITVNAPGSYVVTVTNNCGSVPSAPMDVIVEPVPSDPVTTGDLVCVSGPGTVTATGSNITWTDVLGNVVGTGNSYTSPILTSTTTYYASSSSALTDTSNVGPANGPIAAGANSSSNNWLVFSALSDIKIISVFVTASGAGNRTIELQDNTGAMLLDTTVNVPNGDSRITLNFNVPAGNDYRLVATGALISMYRNNSSLISYPYTIPGVVSITGSSAGDTYYYYFYDWEVETYNLFCSSNAVPATITVDPCLSAGSDIELARSISVYPNPATDMFEVTFNLSSSANVTMDVTDAIGKTIYSNQLGNISGLTKQTVSTEKFGKGIYTLRITADGKNFLRKLVVK